MEMLKSIIKIYVNNRRTLVEIIILLGIAFLLNRLYPIVKGYFGEYWLNKRLNKLPRDKYVVLNNIMLKDGKGTHQIDHIVLSNYGIFVIEMKNYKGIIKGTEHDTKWCQILGKNKYYFFNPIHQNYGHIKCLEGVLGIDEKQFISIVCFSSDAKIKVNSKTTVIYDENINKEILKFNVIKNDFNLEKLKNLLLSENIVDKKERKNHVKTIRNGIKNNEKLENQMICPKCGGSLIEKNGKYGKFMGCSNYPKCHFIKKSSTY